MTLKEENLVKELQSKINLAESIFKEIIKDFNIYESNEGQKAAAFKFSVEHAEYFIENILSYGLREFENIDKIKKD